MATAFMINDCNKINAINPFTATNTFGTPGNGGFYDGPDGTFVVERDERPMEMNDPNEDLTFFTPNHIDRSGPLYLKEQAPSPAPFLGFPVSPRAEQAFFDAGHFMLAREVERARNERR